MTAVSRERDVVKQCLLIFTLLVILGFPGNYSLIIGESLCTLIEYAAFILEFVLMLIYSGDNLLDFKIIQGRRQYVPVYLVILWIMVSTVAVAANKGASFITVFRFAVLVLFALWLADHYSLEEVIRYFVIAEILYDLANVGFIVMKSSWAFYSTDQVYHAFRGMEDAKNVAGEHYSFTIMLFAILLKIKLQKKERGCLGLIFLMAVDFCFLRLCKATGALLCAVAAIIFIFKFSRIKIPVGWIYCAGNVGWILFTLNLLPLLAPLLESLGKDATLTGRTELWNGIVTFMLNGKLWTGYGFCRFWVEAQSYTKLQMLFKVGSFWRTGVYGAHNCLMELWLNIGTVGIAVWFLMILISTRRIRELKDADYVCIVCILFFLFITGLTERIFDNTGFMTMLFFYAMGLGCNRPLKKEHLYSWQKEKLEKAETEER